MTKRVLLSWIWCCIVWRKWTAVSEEHTNKQESSIKQAAVTLISTSAYSTLVYFHQTTRHYNSHHKLFIIIVVRTSNSMTLNGCEDLEWNILVQKWVQRHYQHLTSWFYHQSLLIHDKMKTLPVHSTNNGSSRVQTRHILCI